MESTGCWFACGEARDFSHVQRLCRPMDGGFAEQAPFVVEGPDERGHLWACAADGREEWCDLGPVELVAEMMPEFLPPFENG